MPEPRKILPRNDRRMLVVALAVALVACSGLQRQERLDVTVSGGRHQATAADFGCGGGLIRASRQQQTAGAAGVAAQWSNGLELDGEFGLLSNSVEAVAGETIDRPGDQLVIAAARARLGVRSRFVGADAGGSVYFHGTETLPMPLLAAHAGLIDRFWGEARLGSRDILLDSNVVGLYAHAQFGQNAGISVGFGGASRPMVVRGTEGERSLRMSELNDTVQVEGWLNLQGIGLRASARFGDVDSGGALQVRLPLFVGPKPASVRLPSAVSPAGLDE